MKRRGKREASTPAMNHMDWMTVLIASAPNATFSSSSACRDFDEKSLPLTCPYGQRLTEHRLLHPVHKQPQEPDQNAPHDKDSYRPGVQRELGQSSVQRKRQQKSSPALYSS